MSLHADVQSYTNLMNVIFNVTKSWLSRYTCSPLSPQPAHHFRATRLSFSQNWWLIPPLRDGHIKAGATWYLLPNQPLWPLNLNAPPSPSSPPNSSTAEGISWRRHVPYYICFVQNWPWTLNSDKYFVVLGLILRIQVLLHPPVTIAFMISFADCLIC